MRLATWNAFNKAGNNGSTLGQLLQVNGPALTRYNMMRTISLSDDAVGLRHTGNIPLPLPNDEFPVYYNANYHLRMNFRSPIAGSRNTFSEKQFTLSYEEPPAYNGSTVLY
jgi:hypothetical protein